jgi:DNA processing protein
MAGKLLREFGSPEAVFHASLTALEAQRLPAAVAQAIHSREPLSRAAKELAQVQQAGSRLLTWDEPAYPHLLREIYDPPPVVYIRGNMEPLHRDSIAMVGTRRPTPYGNQMAERLARDLAERGLATVSGLAGGIDSSAHKGALAGAGAATIGVVGCGIDVVYPKENRKIFAEIEKRGAILSEFPMGAPPKPENFPQPGSFGPNQLIKQGAKLVTSWEDVVEELSTAIRAELRPVEATTAEERASILTENLSPTEKTLYELLGVVETRHVDDLVETSGLSSSEVLAALFGLDMRGAVRQLPGKQFLKVLL